MSCINFSGNAPKTKKKSNHSDQLREEEEEEEEEEQQEEIFFFHFFHSFHSFHSFSFRSQFFLPSSSVFFFVFCALPLKFIQLKYPMGSYMGFRNRQW